MCPANQSKWKAIILDLDGTLLRSDGTISAYTRAVLHECQRRGVLIVIATARIWFRAKQYIDMIQPDYTILADGTQIYHSDEMIFGYTMEKEQSNGLIRELLEKNEKQDMFVSIGKKSLCRAKGIEEEWRTSKDFAAALDVPAYKIAATLNAYDTAKGLAEKYGCRLSSYRGEQLYSFTSAQSGKYQAVMALGQMLQIDLEEMLAFGDDENDAEIIRGAGRGVAVANAIPQIREIADDIAECNNADGVAKYIEKEVLARTSFSS